MKSKINFRDTSLSLCFSLRAWIYILGLISRDFDNKHSPLFNTLFSQELLELRQLLDFNPPFKFRDDAFVVLNIKDYVKEK